VIRQYKSRGVRTRKLLAWSGVAVSSHYYKKTGGRKGKTPSSFSVTTQGEIFENTAVVKDIEEIFSQEFCCYGYHNTTGELKERGWIINHWEGLPSDEGKQAPVWQPDPDRCFR